MFFDFFVAIRADCAILLYYEVKTYGKSPDSRYLCPAGAGADRVRLPCHTRAPEVHADQAGSFHLATD